jgi:uncharacterized protein with GYD domain
METYIILTTWSGSAQSVELDNPPDVNAELTKMLKVVGGKLLHTWSTLGRFDMVMVVEVPGATALRAFVSAMPAEVSSESLRAFSGIGAASDPELHSLLKKLVQT